MKKWVHPVTVAKVVGDILMRSSKDYLEVDRLAIKDCTTVSEIQTILLRNGIFITTFMYYYEWALEDALQAFNVFGVKMVPPPPAMIQLAGDEDLRSSLAVVNLASELMAPPVETKNNNG